MKEAGDANLSQEAGVPKAPTPVRASKVANRRCWAVDTFFNTDAESHNGKRNE
jgi:hypothetical protein